MKTQNPRRKLRRHLHGNDRAYENFEPTQHRGVPPEGGKPVSPAAPVVVETSGSVAEDENPTFVSSAYITLKSSQESLPGEAANDKAHHPTTPTDCEQKRDGTSVQVLPLSPTHYQQPPTPDHPPPSALQAERSIHERMRPLSQVSCTYTPTQWTLLCALLCFLLPDTSIHVTSYTIVFRIVGPCSLVSGDQPF
jgi:hypothetical protein